LDAELLSFREVRYTYPNGRKFSERVPALRRHAIEGLSFSVAAGASIALVGANGSGKSTLLQLCNGLLEPDAGTVSWKSEPVDRSRAGLARLRSQVGLLFQDPDDQLFAGTLFQDVAFGPLNQGLAKDEVRDRVEEALAMTDLTPYADLPPHLFSHGMRKRAALAGVLATRPRLLLLDEPTAGLDPRSEDRLLAILSDVVAGGATVVLSTHDLELARLWAREAMVLENGRLAAFGDAGRILTDIDLLTSCGLRRRSGGSKLAKGVVP